jgi:hypothetical protein
VTLGTLGTRDEYKAEISRVMEVHGESLKAKVSQWPDSEDKRRRLAFAEEAKALFPSLSWYILQKPAEVRPMHDHSTGSSCLALIAIMITDQVSAGSVSLRA